MCRQAGDRANQPGNRDPALPAGSGNQIQRVDTYARMKGYVFNEDKEEVLEGLLQKNEQFGDFYCPCRLENIPDNVCPCLDTRKGEVQREGVCL